MRTGPKRLKADRGAPFSTKKMSGPGQVDLEPWRVTIPLLLDFADLEDQERAEANAIIQRSAWDLEGPALRILRDDDKAP